MTEQKVKPANGQNDVAEREILELIQEASEADPETQEPGYNKANILDGLHRMLEAIRSRRT